MQRAILRALLLAAVMASAMSSGGCSTLQALNPFAPRPKPYSEVVDRQELREIRRQDQVRLAGEGIPRPGAATTRPVSGIEGFVEFIEFTFWTLPKRAFQYYMGNTPGKFARMMEDDQSADARRTGMLKLVSQYEFARVDPYTRRYWQIAQGDPDYLVRAAAIRALNRSRDRNSIDIYVRALDDSHWEVRLEAAKALANVPDAKAVPALTRHLAAEVDVRAAAGRNERVQETRDVRVACADALRNYLDKDVAKSLVGALRERDFEVSWQARQSLRLMTGRDYLYDQGKWQEFLAREANPFG